MDTNIIAFVKKGTKRVIRTHAVIMRLFVSLIFIGAFTFNVVAQEIKGTVKATRIRYVENTLIYIDEIPGKEFAPPEEPVKMDQKDLKFVPHVLPILKGTTVEFLNGDAVLHNVFTPDKVAERFNLGSWPQGEVRSYTFKNPGVVVILCSVHPEMEAWTVIVETPYFAVADKDGNFAISDVPPGEYRIKVWNEKLKGSDMKVTVPDEGDVTVEIKLKR